MDFLWQDFTHAPFWLAALKIIFVNVILSGDNAVVIAMACLTLPPKQRLWGMVLGAGVAVLLRVVFTLIIAQAMTYPFLKLIGGALLFYVATKLVTEDADGDDDGVEGAQTLWRAVRIVAIADIVMSLDNVIAIAATAEIAAAQVDLVHATSIKATLIIFGLATSVPLIVAGTTLDVTFSSTGAATITHGLGWTPRVMLFKPRLGAANPLLEVYVSYQDRAVTSTQAIITAKLPTNTAAGWKAYAGNLSFLDWVAYGGVTG